LGSPGGSEASSCRSKALCSSTGVVSAESALV
jgi:hypothetical protein